MDLYKMQPMDLLKVIEKLDATSFISLVKSCRKLNEFIEEHRDLLNIFVEKTLVIKIYDTLGQQTQGSQRFRGLHRSDSDVRDTFIGMRLYPLHSRDPLPDKGTVNMNLSPRDQLNGFKFQEIVIIQTAPKLRDNQKTFLNNIFINQACIRLKFIEKYCDVSLIPFFKFRVFHFEKHENFCEIAELLEDFKGVVEINCPNAQFNPASITHFPYVHVLSKPGADKLVEFFRIFKMREIKTRWLKMEQERSLRSLSTIKIDKSELITNLPAYHQLIDFPKPRLALTSEIKRKHGESGFVTFSRNEENKVIMDFFSQVSTVNQEVAKVVWDY